MDKPPHKLTYRSAGLDLDLYEQSIAGMAPFIRRTHTPRVLDGFGGFASLFSLEFNPFARSYRDPSWSAAPTVSAPSSRWPAS